MCVCVCPVSRELPVEEQVAQTQLHSTTSDEYYTYTNVPWKLYLRKEVGFTRALCFGSFFVLRVLEPSGSETISSFLVFKKTEVLGNIVLVSW